ncbi:tripartite tricarboxylate transporter substrate binding protein [Variovorax guangxiensis]|uniref:Tripartite-type tricarboxylate transporter receptor subunit TctC n=1 Tax=Variovorax guangxiensis TaxID=1775474 RepID=A0A840G6R8_9BURK|nr:tripartite tricarboxylate transporter substrate binding protein [Variovorax guangxiensis]MBB4224941.1 tripartite-type tricarboxylate transporter receptor subunit TctC [Variovorax guangxiensis]
MAIPQDFQAACRMPTCGVAHGMKRRHALAAALAALGAGLVRAQPTWSPKGPVRIVVPFAAGGTSDIIARIVGVRLAEALGQPVLVDNRVGAGGNIGIASVARAALDGQTLLLVSSAFVTNPALFADKPPYDPLRQFAPVSLAVSSPDVIVVPATSPLTSLSALIDTAKRRPGALTYSTPGKGNSVHLGGELLWQRAGIELLHVPYNGAAPAVQAVLGGQVDCALTALPAAKAHIAAGTLRVLAVGSRARWAELPQVPTVAESGFAGYRSETMQALFAPAGTPVAAIERLHTEVRRILALDDVQRQTRELGFETVASLPADLAARVAEDVPRWTAVASRARIRAD